MQEKKYYILYLICLLFVIQAISSCVHRQTEFFNVSDAPLHNTVLKDIATLMIPQPDSALNLIIAVSDTLDESKMTPFDYYEYQVLVSEVLYKNNYSLTNDSALYEAVEYYDSMVAVYPDNIDLQYQQARACYYKGASEEEKENTVEACICYLKSLEIIETIADKNPERKDLCHFKALTYNRLADIYLYCDALNISIECFRNAISCFESENKLYATAINNKKIGDLLYQMKEYDSAMLYLKKADSLCNLAKYNPVLKRDIDKSMAMVLFSSGRDKSSAYSILYQAMSQRKDNDEQMAEYFILIIRGQSLENIDTTVDGNTITINFLADFGSVGIFIETILGSLVAGMTCHIILGKANVQVSGIGTFSFRIVSASATYSG